MRNLLEFFRKYHYWFLFILLEVVSVVLLLRANNYHSSVWFTSANTLTASVDRLYSDWTSYLELRHINRDLTNRNIVLQRQVNQLRDRLYAYEKDSTQQERRQAELLRDYRMIHATVTSNSIHKRNNYLVIDKGSRDGVKPEMGVVGGGGVVGIVFLTEAHYSLVLPILHSRSNISCRIRGHRFFGYLTWDGGNPLLAYLTDVPRYARFKVGDFVETSGYSSVFPAGLFVGRITEIADSSDGLSYRVRVNLSTDFANLRDVCVVENLHRAEVDSLRIHAVEAEQMENMR